MWAFKTIGALFARGPELEREAPKAAKHGPAYRTPPLACKSESSPLDAKTCATSGPAKSMTRLCTPDLQSATQSRRNSLAEQYARTHSHKTLRDLQQATLATLIRQQ